MDRRSQIQGPEVLVYTRMGEQTMCMYIHKHTQTPAPGFAKVPERKNTTEEWLTPLLVSAREVLWHQRKVVSTLTRHDQSTSDQFESALNG